MFGAPIFLAGLVAVGVPVAIHLLARQRTRVMGWGAMEFLRQSINSASSRRNRLRDLLLLLLRALAILFLVLTFAQPLSSRLSFGGGGLETVFIWDVSLSTSAVDVVGKPRQDAMKKALRRELDRLPDDSSVRILLAGSELRWLKPVSLTLSSNNRQTLERAIQDQKPESGGSRLANSILLALAEEERRPEVRTRDIVVVHDCQRGAWQVEDTDRWESIRRKLATAPDITLRIAETGIVRAEGGPQVAVVSLDVARDSVALETPVRFRAALRNDSSESVSGAEVVWLVYGREVERLSGVEIATDEELKLEQFLSFDTEGCHQVECRIELDDDLLPADNHAVAVVSAYSALPVLIVDDSRKTEAGQILPSEFLVASLGGSLKKAKDGKEGKSLSLFNPQVIASKDLDRSALEGKLAVIIANADSLPAQAAADLRDFVKTGGGLWLMTDTADEAPPAWRTELFDALGLEALAGSTRRTAPSPEAPFHLTASNPAGDYARGMAARSMDLFRTEMTVLSQSDTPVFMDEEKLLETPDGIPVLVSLPVGSGHFVLQMNDLSRGSTNLPVLQSFVPFVRETLRQCVGGALPQRNLAPGQPIRIPLIRLNGQADEPLVTLPDGSSRPLELLAGEYQTARTLQPGVYTVSGFRDAAGDPVEEVFAVSRPVEESDLEWIAPEEAEALALSGADPESKASTDRQKGRWPVTIWFAILSAVLFLAEAILANRLVRRREVRAGRIELKPVF